MKKSLYSFIQGFTENVGGNSKDFKAFDWVKAAKLIKKTIKKHPGLIAEAGLQGDWNFTGGVIFEEGQPVSESYTYLQSNWAVPCLLLSWDGECQREIECYESDGKYNSDSKWCDESLQILKK